MRPPSDAMSRCYPLSDGRLEQPCQKQALLGVTNDCETCDTATADGCPEPAVCQAMSDCTQAYEHQGKDCQQECVAVSPVGTTCDDGDACTTSDTCQAGGQCSGVVLTCDSPPAAGCSGNVLQSFDEGPGTCVAGQCEYAGLTKTCGHTHTHTGPRVVHFQVSSGPYTPRP